MTAILVSSVAASAVLSPVAPQAKDKAVAPDNSPVIEKIDAHWILLPSGLERIVYVHYARPPWAGADKGKKEVECYDFLGKGVKWKVLPTSYVVHPLVEENVPGAIFNSAETWDEATTQELFNDAFTLDDTANFDTTAPDGGNEFSFGDYEEPSVIAVAVVWGYFTGPPGRREIIEFDVLFDTDYTWGDATVDTTVMDLQNIATHEIGHGLGLADIYDTACSEVTMYGYSDYEETKKRTLEQPDITGIQELYGA